MKSQLKIISFFFIFSFLFSQNYHIKNFNRKNGLPQVQILSLFQDSRDYLWIGTGGGLSLYDGNKFKNFYLDDGLTANRIFDIIEDNNEIWVAGLNGISSISLDPVKEYSITKLKNSKFDDTIFSLFKYSDVFFIGTRKKGLLLYIDEKIKSISLNKSYSNVSVKKIKRYKNNVWAMYENKALVRLDSIGNTKEIFDNTFFNDLRDFQIIDDNNIMLMKSNSINIYNILERKSSQIINLSKNYSNLIFHSFLFYRDVYYITSNQGLYLVNNNKIQLITISEGLLTSTVSSIIIDREENIWVGSDSYGLNQLISPNIKNFSKNNGLLNPSINSITNIKDTILIGTDDGIYSLVNNTIVKDNKYSSLQNNSIWDIVIDNNESLLIATDNGVYHYINGVLYQIDELKNIVTLNIIIDKYNTIWFCTVDGLYRKRLDRIEKINTKNVNLGEVWDIIYDGEKHIIASQNGLFTYENSKIGVINTSIKNIYTLYLNKIDDFYFGSETGFYRYHNFKVLDLNNLGFKGKIVTNIFKNTNEDLWVAHEEGLDLFNGAEVVEHMDENDGLIGTEITTNNAVFKKNNTFYLGFYGGLSEFTYVNHLKITQPNIYIESVQAYNDTISTNLLKFNTALDYNFNQIKFKFNTPWLKSADAITYICYLEGFEREWKNSLKLGELTYHNLASGSYTFHVKSINHNNIESGNIASFHFIINEPFWENNYIIIMFIILVLLLTFWLFRFYTERINKKNIELERRVRLRTKELFKAKEYIEQIVEFAAIVIVTVDRKGKIVSWNKQGEFVFGYTKKEIITKHIKLLDFVNDIMPFKDIFKQIDEETFISEIDIVKQRSNGSKAYLLFSASSIINSSGDKTGYTLIFSDVSHQKELQEKKEVHQKMMGGIDAINQLLGTMSHHINNSVASILSIIQLHEESNKFEEKVIEVTKEHTNRINSVIKALKILVSNLNLKTKNYAGSSDQVFDIDEDIAEFNKNFNVRKKINKKRRNDDLNDS